MTDKRLHNRARTLTGKDTRDKPKDVHEQILIDIMAKEMPVCGKCKHLKYEVIKNWGTEHRMVCAIAKTDESTECPDKVIELNKDGLKIGESVSFSAKDGSITVSGVLSNYEQDKTVDPREFARQYMGDFNTSEKSEPTIKEDHDKPTTDDSLAGSW